MQNQIFPQQWIHLPAEVRAHLVHVFKLTRTGVSEIRDQEVVSDGFTIDDLKPITHEAMQLYVGPVETFAHAWEVTLAKVHSELHPPVGEIKKVNNEPIPVEVTPEETIITEPTESHVKTKSK